MSRHTNSRPGALGSAIRLDGRNGWIAGICAGIANKLHTDPAFVRVAVVVTALFLPKITIAVYLVAWAILDKKD